MGYNTGKRDFRDSTGGFEQPQEPSRSRERSSRVRRGELYSLRDGLEVARGKEVCAWRKICQCSPRPGQHAGADNQEPNPAPDLRCFRGDSCLSCMVVSRPGEAEPASGPIRLGAHRHLRSVLGRCGGHVVEAEGGGAEDRDLRNQGAYHGEACTRLESRERVQGSERVTFHFTKGGAREKRPPGGVEKSMLIF